MELVKKEQKKLTEQQEQFLEVLFNEAQGNPKKAGDIVGYAPGYYLKVVKSLKEQILERSEYSLAMHSAKAVKGLVDALAEDTDYIEPVQEELDALNEAKEFLNNCSYREVANWLSRKTGRSISHTGLRKIINTRWQILNPQNLNHTLEENEE